MRRIKEKLNKIDKLYFLIFLISLLLMSPLLTKFYFWGHDTGYHISNILAISESLSFHNLLNIKILPIIAHNFGYGSGIFYPSLSHITASIIYLIIKPFGLNVITGIKITDFLCIFLSNFFMYKLLKTVTQNKKLSFIASLFYMTSAYKIYDYLVRDAIAESFIFIFIPFIFLGVYHLLNKNNKKFYFYFIIGYVGLINTHLIMTIYFTIFLAIVLLLNIKKIWNKQTIKSFIIATITVILICLPFIIPLLEHKLLGAYVVFSKNAMANRFGVYGNGLSYQFLIGESKNIGYHFLNLMALVLAIYLVIKLKKDKKIKKDFFLITGLVFTFLGIWMSSLLFPWFLMPNFLLLIQFPWRLGAFTAFGLSILSFYAFDLCKEKQKLLIGLSIVSCMIVSLFCLTNQTYDYVSESAYDLSTYGMGWQKEYLPVNTSNNIEYFDNRDENVLVTSGSADIELLNNECPNLTFKVTNVINATLELPRLYYLGYTIKATTEDGNTKEISYSENDKGFIEIEVSEDSTILVTYTNTKMATIGNYISLITLGSFLVYLIFKRGGKNEERNS